MDKKSLHHLQTRLRKIRIWYLVVLLLTSLCVYGLALRSNNLEMIKRWEAVHEVDKAGGDVEGALRELRSYVYAHMGTSMAFKNNIYPPVRLSYTHQRLIEAEKERVNASNARIYTDAQNYCETYGPGGRSGGNRVACIESYVNEHGTKMQPIPSAMYTFDFVSPNWSPDLAGFSLLFSFVLAAVLVIRMLLGLVLRLVL